ncbi:MAG TPA: nicotinate-nucleotide adenylyltransferase [Thermoanaerobaculia bacterium]|nr:nicotinate-nucleotide adenylyltransferase [Thermoanaerobaculia bacterium]
MNIGVCGGTFDPFHRGHLEPVLEIRGEMQWDRVIYIPAWRQPLKDRTPTSAYHRFAMAVLATHRDPALFVSPVELERGGTSYTVDTLEELHRISPNASFDWIIGDDAALHLLDWKDPERLFSLTRFIVLARGGPAPAPELAGRATAGKIVYVRNESVLISSTDIRARVCAGQPIDGLVDPLVSRYIQHYGLYRE